MMKKRMKSLAALVVVLLAALVMGACSSSNDDDNSEKANWHLAWRAQYLEYRIDKNNLGITPQKLEDEITTALSVFNEQVNREHKYNSSEVEAAVLAVRQKWIDKGWYPYIKYITFRVGVFDILSQSFNTYVTWKTGTENDN